MMRVAFFTLVAFAAPSLGQAQANPAERKQKLWSGDTSFWYKRQMHLTSKVRLQQLAYTQVEHHLRFWNHGQLIDIFSIDGRTYSGSLVNYIEQYRPYDEDDSERKIRKAPKLIYSTVSLNTVAVREAIASFRRMSSIPSQNDIRGWEQGCDGVVYVFEDSTPTTYTFRTYWSPTAQNDTLSEAKQVQSFVDNVEKTLRLRNQYDEFFDALPAGSYTQGMMIVTKHRGGKRAKGKLKTGSKPGALLP